MMTAIMKLKTLAPWKKTYDKHRQHIKKQRHYFANRSPHSQSYSFSSSHVWMWELEHKEGWVLKNWWIWTVVLEKTLESPLDCKDKTSQSKRKSTLNIYGEDGCSSWSSNTLATWYKEPNHWKRPWCWERLKAKGEGSDRGWDVWMASPTQWTWLWFNSRS